MVWGNFLWKNLLDFGGQTPAHMFWGPFFREKNCAKKSNVENKLTLATEVQSWKQKKENHQNLISETSSMIKQHLQALQMGENAVAKSANFARFRVNSLLHCFCVAAMWLQLFRSCRKNWWRPKYVQQGRKDIVKKKQAPPNNTPGNLNFNYSKVFYPF